MALAVTLETFNDVVKENMELLDLTEEEAREETLQQFKSQGADVSRIVLDSNITAVNSALSKIRNSLQKVKIHDQEIQAELTILNHEMVKDLNIRVHAGKESMAYDVLLECLEKMQKPSFSDVVETLGILMDGYPDLLTDKGAHYMIKFLKKKSTEILIINTLKWIKVSVAKHEKNRSQLVTMNIADKFRHVLNDFSTDTLIIIELCGCVRRIIADDDIRVVVGNAHEYARTLASELLCTLTEMLHSFADNEAVLLEILQTVTALIVRNEFCIKVHDQNGVKYILDAMINFPDSEKINRHCMQLLKGLAGSDEVKEPIIKAGAAPLIVSAMNRHKKSAQLVSSACVCISALALRSPGNGKAFTEARVPDMLLDCMTAYKDNPVIQTKACAAIRNHISRCPEVKDEYLQLGIEERLNDLKIKEGKLEYEAKCVLKELGCKVHLDEQWKGTGRHLENY